MAGIGTGIGTGIAIAGLVMSAGGTALSLSQASKQKKLIAQADAAAEAAMERARKMINTNYLEGLSIPKEAYELEREQLAVAGAQALQAGVEGEGRGAAATAGRVQMAQQAGQRQIAAAQEQAMFDLQKQAAAEDARIQSVAANIELGGVQGAQQAVADATAARQAAIGQAASQMGQLGMGLIGNENINPLYKKDRNVLQAAKNYSSQQIGGNTYSNELIANSPSRFGMLNSQQVYLPSVFDSTQGQQNLMNSFIAPVQPLPTPLMNN